MKLGYTIDYVGPTDLPFAMQTLDIHALKSMSEFDAFDALQEVTMSNLRQLKTILAMVGTLPEEMRMVRIGHHLLPYQSHGYYGKAYDETFMKFVDFTLFNIGSVALDMGILISAHPMNPTKSHTSVGKSNTADIVNSISKLFSFMGYDETNAKICLHYNGRGDHTDFLETWNLFSDSSKQMVAIENTTGTDIEELIVRQLPCPIILDLYHHWIRTGEYIETSDQRVKDIFKTWESRNRRPVVHFSTVREEYTLLDSQFRRYNLDDYQEKLNIKQLNKHSEGYPNIAVNRWALGFLKYADIMAECKTSTIGAYQLLTQAKQFRML